MKKNNFANRLYSKKNIYQLFFVCIFPLHFWSIMMTLRDYPWIAERTNQWDAISFIAYSLFYTLLEGVFAFFLSLLAGLLVSTKWNSDQRTGILGIVFLVMSSWAIFGQIYYLFPRLIPAWFSNLLVESGHPLRWLWGLIFPFIVLSVLLPVYGVLHSIRFNKTIVSFFERISTLSIFYLFLDGIAIIIIISRRIFV